MHQLQCTAVTDQSIDIVTSLAVYCEGEMTIINWTIWTWRVCITTLYNRDTKLLLTVYLVFRLNLLDLKPCPWDPGLIANAALWQLKWQAASWHIFMPYFYPKNDTIRNVWIPNSHNILVIWWRRFHILCSRETRNAEGYFFKISKVVSFTL